MGLFERADPGVTFDVITDMSRRNGMPSWKRRAPNHELHALGNDLFVADSVLNRTHRALVVKDVLDLGDCDPGMNCLSRDDPVIAARQLFGVAGRVKAGGKIFRPRKSQAVLLNRGSVLPPHVIGPHFGLASLGEMRGEQASDSSATDDADFHQDLFKVTAAFSLRFSVLVVSLRRCKTSRVHPRD